MERRDLLLIIEKLVYGGDGLARLPADEHGPGKAFWPRRRLRLPCLNKSPALLERVLSRFFNRHRIVYLRLAHIFSAAADAIISTPATSISSKLRQPF